MGPLLVADRDSVRAGFDRWFALAALLAIFILVKIGNWYKRATGFGSPQARRCGGYYGARTLET